MASGLRRNVSKLRIGWCFPNGLHSPQLNIRYVCQSHVCIQSSSPLTRATDVPAFLAIIRFSHPWRNRKLITTIHRTICQDSTAYFLSVLSIQIFVTVAVSSGAPVSPHRGRLNNRRFSPHPSCSVPSDSLPCHVSPPPIVHLTQLTGCVPLGSTHRTNVCVYIPRA